ncbi:hypothetical protein Vafri_11266, partial [Volvox africanus]
GEGGLFDMDIVMSLRVSIDCPGDLAAARAGAGAGVDQTDGIGAAAAAKGETGADAMGGLRLSADAPGADSQMQTQESVSSLDRRLIETVQALAAASGGGDGGGTGGDSVQATGVSLQKKLKGGVFAEAGAPTGSDGVNGGAVEASDGRRGPAWVIRRASQARQDQIVGEISSWLREALVRKASNAPERPDAAAAFTEDGGEDGGEDAAEDREASAGHLTAPAAGAVAERSRGRVQSAGGWGPGDAVSTPGVQTAAAVAMTGTMRFGAASTTAEPTPRHRRPNRSQTSLSLGQSKLQGAPLPPMSRSPILAPWPPPPPARASASTAAPAPAQAIISHPASKRLPKKAASLSAEELRERMRAAAADAMSFLKRPGTPRGAAAAVVVPE